jgi:hypothetical protein
MALSKREESFLWLGGAAVLLAVLWWLWHRVSNTTVVNQATPTYTSYNISSGPWGGTASGLPTLASQSNSSDCGCTSANSGNFFSSLSDMLNTFTQGSTAAFNAYESGVASQYPNWVTQYFNNPTGVSQWAASTRILTDPSQTQLNDNGGVAPNSY